MQLERFGYAHASLPTKLQILKTLCERQFDLNLKLREQLANQTGQSLRVLPIGTDRDGQSYWYQLDVELNLRIYSEELDDSAGATWMIRAQ